MQWLDVEPGYRSFLSDESRAPGRAEKICFPGTAEEAAQAVREAKGRKLTIQGSRTGLISGAVPEGGWILNLSKLQKIGPVDASAGTVQVEAGVTLEDLQKALGPGGLCFPPDPTEETASLGGMFSTNAAGPRCLKYGRTGDWVRSALWLTSEGELQTLKGEALSALAGSEGRQGAVLNLELQLMKKPRESWAILFFFPTEEKALSFGRALASRQDESLAGAEYLDGGALELLRAHRNHPSLQKLPDLPVTARGAILTELQGEEDLTPALMDLLDLFEAQGGREEDSWAESDPAGIRRLRELRHAVPALLGELPGIRGAEGTRYEGDFRGRPQDWEACVTEYRRLLDSFGIPGAVYGHLLGNGLRLALLPENDSQMEACPGLLLEAGAFLRHHGGEASGEYGRSRWMGEGL